MKPVLKPTALAAALLCMVIPACSDATPRSPAQPQPPPTSPTAAKEGAPVQPAAPPEAPAPALDAKPSIPLHDAMEQVDDADLEGSLENWADGKEIDLDHVIKRTGVFLDVWPKADWKAYKKRDRDPAGYDRLVLDAGAGAQRLVGAAKAGNKDEVKTVSDRLLDTCTGCHKQFK